jgi:hypothetical protein
VGVRWAEIFLENSDKENNSEKGNPGELKYIIYRMRRTEPEAVKSAGILC